MRRPALPTADDEDRLATEVLPGVAKLAAGDDGAQGRVDCGSAPPMVSGS